MSEDRIRELETSLFVLSLILQAQQERVSVFNRENAHLRVIAQKVVCPYNMRGQNGGCMLGYPGCACMDDQIALTTFDMSGPGLPNAALIQRMQRRANALEVRLLNARERIDMAARNYRSLAEGFQLDRSPSKAAAVRAMADLMEAPL